MGWGRSLSFGPHGHRHRLLRRLLSSALNPTAANAHEPLQTENITALIEQIISQPTQFMHAVNEATSSFIMRLAYGYILEKNDPFIEVSREAIRYFSICTMSHFWVNWFPISKLFDIMTHRIQLMIVLSAICTVVVSWSTIPPYRPRRKGS